MNLPPDARWRDQALCAQTDAEVFFPRPGQSAQAAKQICKNCPVQRRCLIDGLSRRDLLHGVLGGATPAERRRMLLDTTHRRGNAVSKADSQLSEPCAVSEPPAVPSSGKTMVVSPSTDINSVSDLAPSKVVPGLSLLERGFPTGTIGELARSRRHRPPLVYGAHKWWARRPAPSIRALLIAASCDAGQTTDFWKRFNDPTDTSWRDGRVCDPFVGGGTSLVEAQRLGAAVYGVDVDPLAVLLTEHELEPLDLEEFKAAASGLMRYLSELCADLYPKRGLETPLHHFWVREVTCAACGRSDLLYKSLVLARDLGRRGAVVRDKAVTAFCPECYRVHELPQGSKTFSCCNREVQLSRATYVGGRFLCTCGVRQTHEQLLSGRARRILVAIEVTALDGKRKIREPTLEEKRSEKLAASRLSAREAEVVLPRRALSGTLKQYKPGIYGFSTYDSLFTDRQLYVFGSAFAWLREQLLSRRVKNALALAVSNALSSNNILCGYAVDYGRLAPLFSIRDYSMPALSVELNPLHESAGRGTISAMLRRVARSKHDDLGDVRDSSVKVADAARVRWPDTGGIDLILTDPPYFDYIAYSDLSSFFRSWLEQAELIEPMQSGRPLFDGAGSRADFAARLGGAFSQARLRLKKDGMLAFTYHASTVEGWRAVAEAIEQSGFVLTAAFPLWADGLSPGHGHHGNLEYDLVLCCRPAETRTWMLQSAEDWRSSVPPEQVRDADVQAWEKAAEELNKFAGGQ